MPRAALLSIHARIEGATPDIWEHPSLVGIWGPRYSTYIVPAVDRAVFTLGRMPDDEKGRQRADSAAQSLRAHIGEKRLGHHDVGGSLGVNPNSLRYGAVTGEIVIRWAGALQPTIWMLPRPDTTPRTPDASWHDATCTSSDRRQPPSLPNGRESAVAPASRRSTTSRPSSPRRPRQSATAGSSAATRPPYGQVPPPLPRPASSPAATRTSSCGARTANCSSPDPRRRSELWTSRVWPGALLVNTEIAGVWRRASEIVTIDTWRPLTKTETQEVETEAAALPLPGLTRPIQVRWTGDRP